MNKVKNFVYRHILKFLGITGALFIFEACYGVPHGAYRDYLISEGDSLQQMDSIQQNRINTDQYVTD